jgi:hypothetical protein
MNKTSILTLLSAFILGCVLGVFIGVATNGPGAERGYSWTREGNPQPQHPIR